MSYKIPERKNSLVGKHDTEKPLHQEKKDDTTARLKNSTKMKPERTFSKTATSNVDYDDENQNVLFGEHFDENSEYFSMLGEVGSTATNSFRTMELRLEDVEEIRKMFNIFDQDGNGIITANELRTIMSSLGQSTTEAEVMDMVNSIDSDGNGVIEFPEFLAMVNGTVPSSFRPSQLERIFKVFDVDNSNEIDAENLKRMFRIFGQDFDSKMINEMLKEVDTDGDGKVGLEDFIRMMSS